MIATTTALLISAGLAAAGTAASMYSTSTQANQQASNLKYQAAQGEANARTAQGEALVEAERIRNQAKSARATATAQAAASGVDVSSPTAVRIDEKITANSEEDALLTILNGKDQGARLNQQSAIDRQSAKMTLSNARTDNFGTLLSGASKVTSIYTNWKTGN